MKSDEADKAILVQSSYSRTKTNSQLPFLVDVLVHNNPLILNFNFLQEIFTGLLLSPPQRPISRFLGALACSLAV